MRAAGKAMACLLALAGVAAQDVPAGPGQEQDRDVVVTGEVTRIEPGLWAFERRPTRLVTTRMLPPTGRRMTTGRGSEWRTCIAEDALPDAVRQVLGAGKDLAPRPGCSRMKVEIRAGRVAGRQSCTTYGIDRKLSYEGRLSATGVDVASFERSESEGIYAEATSRLIGKRIGTCDTQRLSVRGMAAGADPVVATAAPLQSTPPASAATPQPPAAPEQPMLVRSDDDHDYHVDHRPPPPKVAGEAEDVVVVARKLRRMRLHYGTDGKSMRFCHADISSGDPRIDRIGCAMLRRCVRAGYDNKPEALACLNRLIDFVDAPAAPQQSAGGR